MEQRTRRDLVRLHEIATIWSKRAELGPYPVILVLDRLKAGYNVGKIVRSANALGVREVFLINIGPWDPILSRGAYKRTRTRALSTVPDALKVLRNEGYTTYALHPRAETALGATEYPEKTAFILGHEEFGFSFDLASEPDVIPIRIPQVGIVESMNVAVAASIAVYDYLRERKLLGTVAETRRATPRK
jgi:tRNA G18 (ribose-2'-O)-methylase SpoU